MGDGVQDPFWDERSRMIERQLRSRGIADERVLQAMTRVWRHLFVPEPFLFEAYDDHPLPIDEGQTISQPYIVALMTEALRLVGKEKVLEVGTGSGYQTAVLAELVAEVVTMERSSALSSAARARLDALGYGNIRFVVGDGTLGLPGEAPFPRILLTGSLPRLPHDLLAQLSTGGILVAPIGDRTGQDLVRVLRKGDAFERQDLGACCFVPLIGEKGWPA